MLDQERFAATIKLLRSSPFIKHLASLLLLLIGIKLFTASKVAAVPLCADDSVIEKLKIVVSSRISGEKYSVNKVESVYDIIEIDAPSNGTRSCRAGVRAEEAGYNYVNYNISLSANGSKEKYALNISFE